MPPSTGGEPLQCLLLSTLPLETLEQVVQCVQWYRNQWLIERFHYTLQSGCGMAALQWGTAFRLRRVLATNAIVARRLIWLTYPACLTPAASCEVVLQLVEWRLLRRRFVPKSPSKKLSPRWEGFWPVNRDGDWGLKTLWRGLTKLHDLMKGTQICAQT
ncbi:MAG: hypothetical protein AAGD09_05405 [Cyanobacteria bacterium P01_F01_bin.56]